MNEAELEEFSMSYYRSGSPERAVQALAFFVGCEQFFPGPHAAAAGPSADPPTRHSQTVMGHFFTRIGQTHPSAVRGYEAVLEKAPESGDFLLTVLRQVGDERTKAFLSKCLHDERFSPLADQIRETLRTWSAPGADVLQQPIRWGGDLDFLWVEFFVTGSRTAVVRIIDVLEWPDLLRQRLLAWLSAKPWFGIPLWSRRRRRRVIEALHADFGIVCDLARQEIHTPEDLDCLTCESAERFRELRSIFPVSLSEQDLQHVATKQAAAWSLASNALQHRLVLETCEAEAAQRTGRCRLTLLGITERARRDIVDSFA